MSARTRKRPTAASRHRKPIADSVTNELGRRGNTEFSHHGRTVCLDRLEADAESVGDPLVALTFGDKGTTVCSLCVRSVPDPFGSWKGAIGDRKACEVWLVRCDYRTPSTRRSIGSDLSTQPLAPASMR